MTILLRATALCVLLAGCAAPDGLKNSPRAASGSAPSDRPWLAPDLTLATSIRDGHDGHLVSLDEMLDELARFDVVFLGKTHTDETTHRVELAVYEGMLKRRQGAVVLAMEMFERDVQGALDDYLAGSVNESAFLERSRPWGNYHTAYRPLVESARRAGKPVLASNFPRPLRQRLAGDGEGLLEALRAEVPELVPAELMANTPAYWRRVDNAVRGHLAMMGGSDQSAEERLVSTQSLWDNSMGETCALALDRYPGHQVVHVNGGFHSSHWDGTARQLALRRPDARVATVHIVPASNPSVAGIGDEPVADFVVFAESRANDVYDGHWAVSVSRDVDYLFHLPEEDSDPVPLLVWFGDDGLAARDGLALWRERLGQDCAIAVLESPYRETQEDLGEGGRWFWPDTFSADIAALQVATERSVSFLLRHYALDPQRICLAGEGTGATVVAAVALLSSRYDFHGVAFDPRRFAKIRDFPLPLSKTDREGAGSLRLAVQGEARDWWTEEFRQYEGLGFDSRLMEAGGDPWHADQVQERVLCETLGLPGVKARSGGSGDSSRRHILAESPRARFWARLEGLKHRSATGDAVAVIATLPDGSDSTPIEVARGPESFDADHAPPRCPGSFGGTTILVLPPSSDDASRAAWLALEENDPLNARSRFYRLRIATLGGPDDERDLSQVLTTLIAEGRSNVLIVPAEFCADGETMRSMKARTSPLDDQLTVHWRPGLGGLD